MPWPDMGFELLAKEVETTTFVEDGVPLLQVKWQVRGSGFFRPIGE